MLQHICSSPKQTVWHVQPELERRTGSFQFGYRKKQTKGPELPQYQSYRLCLQVHGANHQSMPAVILGDRRHLNLRKKACFRRQESPHKKTNNTPCSSDWRFNPGQESYPGKLHRPVEGLWQSVERWTAIEAPAQWFQRQHPPVDSLTCTSLEG